MQLSFHREGNKKIPGPSLTPEENKYHPNPMDYNKKNSTKPMPFQKKESIKNLQSSSTSECEQRSKLTDRTRLTQEWVLSLNQVEAGLYL